MGCSRRSGMGRPKAQGEMSLNVVEQREMTDLEVETVASLLFTWWRREFEQQNPEAIQSKREANDR
jgi:hypothetical protein